MFKFNDLLEIYQIEKRSDNIFAMLTDYTLDSRVDRSVLNKKILLQCGVLHPLYNETTVMKFAIEEYFDEVDSIVKRLMDLYENDADFDPFKTIDWKEDYAGTRDDVNTENETIGETNIGEANALQINGISAYDNDGFQNQSQASSNSNTKDTSDRTRGNSFRGDRDETHNIHHYGKDGTESYAELLDKARNTADWNIYKWLVDGLERRVCLGVY